MINFIKTWSNQIIVAIIIATIFEMILPNNNKKYIKMVIGIYVLFTMLQPIVTKLTGNEITISTFNYKKYFDEDILDTSSINFENNNSKLIEQSYIENIKNDIKAKVQQKGYKVVNSNINIITNENSNNYGAIQRIELTINKLEENKDENTNKVEIENVKIDLNNEVRNEENEINITEEKKKEIIEFLSEEYSIDKTNIILN